MSQELHQLPELDRAAIEWAIGWIDRLEAARGKSVVHAPVENEPGVLTIGWVELPQEVEEFLQGLYRRGLMQTDYTDEVERLKPAAEDPARIRGLSARDCLMLLTYHVRSDRFSEGHLAGVLDRGDVTAILRRLAEIQLERQDDER